MSASGTRFGADSSSGTGTGTDPAGAATVTVRVLAFARLRELLGFGERAVAVPAGGSIDSLWSQLVEAAPQLADLRASTRFARNGALTTAATALHDGDEIALLPPVGGG